MVSRQLSVDRRLGVGGDAPHCGGQPPRRLVASYDGVLSSRIDWASTLNEGEEITKTRKLENAKDDGEGVYRCRYWSVVG